MRDSTTIKRIEWLHPAIRNEVYSLYNEIVSVLNGRAICRFSHTLRTFEEQDALYAKGRSAKGRIVTNAKGGHSYHNYGLAIDIVLLKDTNGDGSYDTASWETNVDFDGDGKADWMEVVAVFKKYGYEWGGDWKRFKDLPHFQKTFGKSIPELLSLHKAKKTDPDGYVLLNY